MKSILRQIAQIERMSHAELKARWRELYGSEPAGYSRAYLVRRLAYRVQELAHGGLSDATRAQLREHLNGGDQDATGVHNGRLKRRKRKDGLPVVGTRLVREWHGQRHEVTVVDGAFEYGGRRYRSLSAIAKAITGAHWSGRLFFGLRQRKEEK